MADKGIHYLVLASSKERYKQVTEDLIETQKQFEEAKAEGDLSENFASDDLRERVKMLAREQDALRPVLSMSSVEAPDVDIVTEGCVIDLTVYTRFSSPVKPGSEEFESLKEENGGKPPEFHGVLAFGGALPIHVILTDFILSVDSPVGRSLLHKRPGDYCFKTPDGFSALTVKIVHGVKSSSELYCEFGGVRHENK